MPEQDKYDSFTLEIELSLFKYLEEDVNLERNADQIRSISTCVNQRKNNAQMGFHSRGGI